MWLKKEATQQICSREMRALEVNAEYFGITLLQLMENAGRNVADEVVAHAPQGQKVAVFCGLGGNGGDGFVAARHLAAMGYKPTVFLAGKTKDVCSVCANTPYAAKHPAQCP